jgi:hypothetical protein
VPNIGCGASPDKYLTIVPAAKSVSIQSSNTRALPLLYNSSSILPARASFDAMVGSWYLTRVELGMGSPSIY